MVIRICIEALKKIPPTTWIDSFNRVNLHPDHRVSFKAWMEKIPPALLASGAFVEHPMLHDALPAVWSNMTVEQRHQIKFMLDAFHQQSEEPWNKTNVMRLCEYVALDDIPKICAAYLLVKEDPAMMLDPPSLNTIISKETQKKLDNYVGMSLKPTEMTKAYQDNKNNGYIKNAFFDHMSNHAAIHHKELKQLVVTPGFLRGKVVPSDYLDVKITVAQVNFLNPTTKQLSLGTIFRDTVGSQAKMKVAKWRQCFITGNISSYSRVLNRESQLKMIKEQNQLAAAVAEVGAEQLQERCQRRESEKKKREIEAQKKREEKEAEEQRKKAEILPGIQADVMRGFAHMQTLPVKRLKEILQYQFSLKGTGTMTKPLLIEALAKEIRGLDAGTTEEV